MVERLNEQNQTIENFIMDAHYRYSGKIDAFLYLAGDEHITTLSTAHYLYVHTYIYVTLNKLFYLHNIIIAH